MRRTSRPCDRLDAHVEARLVVDDAELDVSHHDDRALRRNRRTAHPVTSWGQDQAGRHPCVDERHHLGHPPIAIDRDEHVDAVDRGSAQPFEHQITARIGLDEHHHDTVVADQSRPWPQVAADLSPHSQRKRGMAEHRHSHCSGDIAPHRTPSDDEADDRHSESDQMDGPEVAQWGRRAGSGDTVHPRHEPRGRCMENSCDARVTTRQPGHDARGGSPHHHGPSRRHRQEVRW